MPARLEAMLAIGKLLAPKAKRLAAAVGQAVTDPAGYVAAHAKSMRERGIDEPTRDLPWIALVDALTEAGAVFEIDWKSDPETVEWAIRKLAPKFSLPPAVTEDDDRYTWELLEQSGIALREAKQQLVHLDEGADAYTLVVVPVASYRKLAALVKQAGYAKPVALGDRLAAAQKDAAARRGKLARAQRRPAPTQPGWAYYGNAEEVWTIQVHAKAVTLGYETQGVKQAIHHTFDRPATCKAYAEQLVAGWRRDGFRTLSAVEIAKLPQQGDPDSAYLDIALTPPYGCHYFIVNKLGVVGIGIRGDAVFELGGVLGKTLGELETYEHVRDVAAAFDDRLSFYERSTDHAWIGRAALVKRYKRLVR